MICLKSAIENIDSSNVKINEPDSEFVSIESDILKNEEKSAENTTKIVAKLFINDYSDSCIADALSRLEATFNGRLINTLILAYHPGPIESGSGTKDKWVWGENNPESKENFRKLWSQLQKFLADGKVWQIIFQTFAINQLFFFLRFSNFFFNLFYFIFRFVNWESAT